MHHSLVPMAHVKSVPRSLEFYEKLGFTVRNTFVPDGRNEASWAWMQAGGAHLMLTRADEPFDAEQQAVLFYLYCGDVPAFRSALQERGVAVGEIQYPFYAPRGEFRVADPDGFVLMVTHT
jgi:catechol 2,3-dioxygenase-like lactoylglutathione lyase family enzyme